MVSRHIFLSGLFLTSLYVGANESFEPLEFQSIQNSLTVPIRTLG
jgi:hypothetical protein